MYRAVSVAIHSSVATIMIGRESELSVQSATSVNEDRRCIFPRPLRPSLLLLDVEGQTLSQPCQTRLWPVGSGRLGRLHTARVENGVKVCLHFRHAVSSCHKIQGGKKRSLITFITAGTQIDFTYIRSTRVFTRPTKNSTRSSPNPHYRHPQSNHPDLISRGQGSRSQRVRDPMNPQRLSTCRPDVSRMLQSAPSGF